MCPVLGFIHGNNRTDTEKNYIIVCTLLAEAGEKGNTSKAVFEAAAFIANDILHSNLQFSEPQHDNSTEVNQQIEELKDAAAEKGTVNLIANNIEVYLDKDQLKHQHPRTPIGDRQVKYRNQFLKCCDAVWHRKFTLPHMANWAATDLAINKLTPGKKEHHGQSTAVTITATITATNGTTSTHTGLIHFEGVCLLGNNGEKYVLFHCYPEDNSCFRFIQKEKNNNLIVKYH